MSEQWRIFWAIICGSFGMGLGAGIAANALGVSPAQSATLGSGIFIACVGAGIWRQGA